MADTDLFPHKQSVFAHVDRNAEAIARLGDAIYYFGELGMQERRSAGLMADVLEEHGFEVARGISGMPTAFLASYGSGAPVIAVHTEYDANPDNSQTPGVADHQPIIEGAPGHCEGHNVNAAVMVAAGLAVKGAMEEHGVGGTLKLFGSPGEEQIISRPYFVRDGLFDDVDLAFHDHIHREFKAEYGLMQYSVISVEFVFRGETAHGAYPWRGRDALDAVMMMDAAMAQHRGHMEPTMRAGRVVTDGGNQPNVIPARASIWWYLRGATAQQARSLLDHARACAQAAAAATNTEAEEHLLAASWPVRGNRTMAEVTQGNVESVGVPEWSAEEQEFARALQRKAGVEAEGLKTAPIPLDGPTTQNPSGNDCGDISWVTPMVRLSFPSNVPNIGYHHWAAGAALATSIAHKGAVAGAKALAASVLDFFHSPALVAEAKRTFKEEIGAVVYEPLIPLHQHPPIDRNKEAMAYWRPLQEAHYRSERPVFV